MELDGAKGTHVIPLGDFLDLVEVVDFPPLVGVGGGLVDGREGVGGQHLGPEVQQTTTELELQLSWLYWALMKGRFSTRH